MLTLALSANEVFKLRYPRYLRGAVLAALMLTALGVWLFPRYEPIPYQLRQKEVMTAIDIPEPPLVRQEPRIPPPTMPPRDFRPVPPDYKGPIDDPLPWEPWHPNPFPPYPPAGGGEGFVPSGSPPRLLSQAKPDYPEIARRAGLEGTVLVRVLVAPDGRVRQAELVQGVHPLLDRAAVAAALRSRFDPALQRGVPVRAWMAMPFRFRLH